MTLVFDTETTGKADFNAPPKAKHQPRLVQLGALLFDSDWKIRAELNLIIKPIGFEISTEVAAIHGITQELASYYGVSEYEVLSLFRSLLASTEILVAHNIVFDSLIMGRAFAEHGLTVTPPKEKFCTMNATTNICKLPGFSGKYKWPKLEEAYWHLFNEKFSGAHDAMADVRACARIYQHLKKPETKHTVEPIDVPVDKEDEYNDMTPMPFGKHKGELLQDVPADYFHWLWTNEGGCRHRQIKAYIQKSMSALKQETPNKIW